MNNKTEWQNYEQITAYIYEQLGKLDGIKIVGFGSNCKLKGISGINHQFDVLAEIDKIHKIKIGIECKHWQNKVDEDVVATLYNHITDCGLNLGVIVSLSGYTDDAIQMAKFRGIELVILKNIEPADFDGLDRILGINLKIIANFPSYKVDCVVKTGKPLDKTDNKFTVYNNGNHKIIYANGKEEDYFAYLRKETNEIISTRDNNEVTDMEKECLFPEGTFIYFNNSNMLPLARLIIKLSNIKINTTEDVIEVSLIDNYKKIFHILFSGKKYTLSDKGEVEILD